ncbi:CRISPR system precrRNA processing endoribonuclease RAMP protein Cas6 [Nocardiopsis sp. LOL_012]|uniref:CRISPR system precrRNA processing endoribonuclease RAMP protein Cas6 n=1 Tax=Nocardiopsis sp. LOL_012 TaxID=3345409 RepID=UPI003A8AE452
MPTRWTLTLTPRPSGPVRPAHLHALACTLLEEPGDDHTAQVKPFTAALAGDRLLLSWLDDPTEPELPSRPDTSARLGGRTHRLQPGDRNTAPYARLAAAPPSVKVRVEFVTPAYISRAGRQLPLPEPELLLAGLARRWDVYSPRPLPSKAVTELLGAVHLARHDIRTAAVGAGSGQRVGFVGRAVFGLPPRTSHAAQRAFAALWSFAAFAGAGAQTTHGLGHVRVHVYDLPASQDSTVRERNTGPIDTTLHSQNHQPIGGR